ncbi:DUF6443 domain-containing protein [Emticicia sp. C21]|uniref:DUF6443 domain-containing protein n=1 Tax=Emticicia sp. C21 TaxID=2302915 RepID=UPI000E34B9D3|nr:DUF6443 domain-containing protein [Emticicia sp. C21]RFS15039.1 RHS repeat-associated core domain-containing protein [Emticicia sp. C21]
MKKIYLLFILFIWAFIAVAQSEALKMTLVPPSPNAAQLGKYGEIPINLSTGAPSYNIPIYTIAEGDLNWSIDLNYNYTGFKPSEGASWVGRGWTLSGGGVITRTTQGIRDESVNGYFSKGTMVATSLNERENNLPVTIAIHEDASKGTIDGEPDMFHFNFGAYSGKFFYGADGLPHIVSNRKIKIERLDANTTTEDGSHTPDHLIVKWTLTTEDGTIYIFDVREYTVSSYLLTTTNDAPSAWHLSEIISPSGRKLKFYYTTLGTTKSIQTSFVEKGVSPNCPNPSDIEGCIQGSATFTNEEGVRYNYSEERFLTKIESSSGYNQVLFNTDIVSTPVEDKTSTSRRLTGIDVKNKYSTELISSYEFKYDDVDKYALMSYGEISKIGEKKPPFKFSYLRERIANVIPGYTKALDYWGYYNAAYNNSLIPQKGANRVPSFDEASTGALSKITYPTGGTTKFEYEQNEYSYTSGGLITGQQVISELHQYTIKSTQGIGNVAFTVPDEAQYFIEYQCAKDPTNSNPNPNCNCPSSWTNNKKYVYPTTKLQPNVTYNASDFISNSVIPEVTCYDDLIIVAKVTVYKPVGNNKKFGPGIRVKKTISAESAASTTPIVKEYFYNSISDPTKSSGGLSREPLFAGLATFPVGSSPSLQDYNFYRTESIVTIGSPFVIYEDVEERTNGTNKIIYNYSSYKALYNDINTYPYNQLFDPIGTTENYDFTRGLLLSKKIYKGTTTTIVSQTDYSYLFQKDGGPGATLGGYKSPSFFYEFLVKAPDAISGGNVNVGFGKFYLTASGWIKKTGETTIVKDMDGNNPMTTTINYSYEPSNPKHFQVVQTSTTKSDGASTEIINKYPLDYESVSPKQSFITDMIANNIVSPIIEQQKWVNRGGVRTLVGTSLNYFKSLDVNTLQGYTSGNTELFPKAKIIVPDKQYTFFSNQPIDETTANTKLFTGYTFDNSIYREKLRFENFDARSNLRQQIHLDSDNTAYLWGYKGMYLIAEIKNCTTSTLEAALITIGSSISEIYELENEATIQTKMLALRGALTSSLVTSYTHFPLIGVASETDPSGNKTRYVYDTFNRLKEIYNTNDKLVKSYKYEYTKGDGVVVGKPATPIFIGSTNICSGYGTTLLISNCDGLVVWDDESFIGNSRELNPSATTTYTAYCLSEENVPSDIATVTVNVTTPTVVPIASSNSPKNVGETINLTATASVPGTYTYSWSGPNGFTSPPAADGNAQITEASVNNAGIYTVTLTTNGCPSTSTIKVVINVSCGCTDCGPNGDAISDINPGNGSSFFTTGFNYVVSNTYLTSGSNAATVQSITYYDGIGRTLQSIARGVEVNGEDRIQPVEYDAFGRVSKTYMPYPKANNNGAFVNDATNKSMVKYGEVYGDTHSFAEVQYDNSPLNRVLRAGSVGADYGVSTNKAIKYTYRLNTAADNVKKLIFDFGTDTSPLTTENYTINNSGMYEAQSLSVTLTHDENDNESYIFKNVEGQVVLARSVHKASSETSDPELVLNTYYVYDDFGQLRCTIPPKAEYLTNSEFKPFELNTDNTFKYKLIIALDYDQKGRVIKSKSADVEVMEEMVYNTLDQLELQKTRSGKWLRVTYDDLGRNKATFLYTGSGTPTIGATIDMDKQTESFYDTYGYPNQIAYRIESGFPSTYNTNPKGKLTGTWVKYIGNGVDADHNYRPGSDYYNEYGQVIQMSSTNHKGGTDYLLYSLDFVGRVKRNLLIADGGTEKARVEKTYSYNQSSSVKSICQRTSSGTTTAIASDTYWEPVARYGYNSMGEMIKDTLGCTLQIVDYQYTLQGWLKKINNVGNLESENDFFGMTLDYGGFPYNGTITQQKWQIAQRKGLNTAPFAVEAKNIFTDNYTYDNRYQLKSSELLNATVSTFRLQNMSYDNHGNILSMNRWLEGSGNVDQLSYTYAANSNRLLKITDGVTTANATGHQFFDESKTPSGYTGDDYAYDNSGNMIQDKNKGINSGEIEYNYLNLPNTIKTNAYIYTADGDMVQMRVGDKTIDYIGGVVFKDNAIEQVPTANGRTLKPLSIHQNNSDPNTAPDTLNHFWRYEYQITDHLGNMRVACRCQEVAEANQTDYKQGYPPRMVQEATYDPWGVKLPVFGNPDPYLGQPADRFLYNGKEYENEMGLYNFGARMYDPTVGRWFVPDPIDQFDDFSPYGFVLNDPMNLTDPDGMQVSNTLPSAISTSQSGRLVTTVVNDATRATFNKIPLNLIPNAQQATLIIAQKAFQDQLKRQQDQFNNQMISFIGPNSKGFYGTVQELQTYNRNQYFTNLKYLHEIQSGGIAGAMGHYFWGDKGAEIGTAVDGLAGAAAVVKTSPSLRPTTLKPPQKVIPNTTAFAKLSKPALRKMYEHEVKMLSVYANEMRLDGKSPEEIARTMHSLRRELGVTYKSLTPEALREEIYQRNLEKYGDKLGPTIDYLRQKGKSWDDIINSAIRSGGGDLNFNKK